jgi:drug/metabolite transporter (DMT)-like permease
VLTVLVWSQLAMFVLLWLVVLAGVLLGELEVQARTILLGAAGGVAGVVALAAFYRALAIGPMSVVPPIAAAGVVVPVVVGLVTGMDPTPIVLAGMALAVVGVLLASIGEGTNDDDAVSTRIAPTTLLLCLVAASGFGLIIVAIDAAASGGAGSALVATTGVRTGSVAVLLVATIAIRARPWQGVSRRPAAGFLAIGLFDTGANLAFAVATTMGELAVVAVLGSLYPAVTSAFAHVVLGERLGRVQLVGVALALAGVGVLALR